jgi:hypothetical protein
MVSIGIQPDPSPTYHAKVSWEHEQWQMLKLEVKAAMGMVLQATMFIGIYIMGIHQAFQDFLLGYKLEAGKNAFKVDFIILKGNLEVPSLHDSGDLRHDLSIQFLLII